MRQGRPSSASIGWLLFFLLLTYGPLSGCKWENDTALTTIDGRSLVFQFPHVPPELQSLLGKEALAPGQLASFLAVFEIRSGLARFALKLINGIQYSSVKRGIYQYKKVLGTEGVLYLMESVSDAPNTDATTFTLYFNTDHAGEFTMRSPGSQRITRGTFTVVRQENSAQYF